MPRKCNRKFVLHDIFCGCFIATGEKTSFSGNPQKSNGRVFGVQVTGGYREVAPVEVALVQGDVAPARHFSGRSASHGIIGVDES